MKFNHVLLFCFVLLFFKETQSQTPSDDPHWQLIFYDEFNSIDTDKWDVANNDDHGGGEAQVYTNRSDNVYIDNSNIVLKVKQDNYSCPTSVLDLGGCSRQRVTGQPYNYTSGLIQTKPDFNIKYGFIESRIKLPYDAGYWPAFWTFNGVNSLIYNEIDIFEMVPGHVDQCSSAFTEGRVIAIHDNYMGTTNIHSSIAPTCEPACNCENKLFYVNNYTQYHTYAIEWDPSKIIFYVDGNVVRHSAFDGISIPQKVILNLALNPWVEGGNSAFPAEMKIDYVKMYKLVNDCNAAINTCMYDFSQHDNKVKDFIHIGNGSSCSNVLNSGDNIFLRATSDIEFSGDFSVPIGASLFADVGAECGLDCSNEFSPCIFNYNNYDNILKKKIRIGGNGCTANVSTTNNTSLFLKATDEIILSPETQVIPNSNLIKLSIENCNN